MELTIDHCPLCGTELSRVKLREIEAKLDQEERQRATELAQSEEAIRLRLERQFAQDLEKRKREAVKRAKEDADQRIKQVTVERDQAAKKLTDVEARELAGRKQLQELAEKQKLKELADQRHALEDDKTRELQKQKSDFNRERESLQKTIQVMKNKLEKKTSNEIGDGAEIDLFEDLREAFRNDRITRVPKGQSGADILHEVLYKGEPCGKIIIDSKNRQSWQNAFVTKLRQDQVDAGAEHAILATTAFPAGKKELCIESGVIVMNPARVVHVTQILRQAIVAMHLKGLSMKERATKMTRLYDLITSECYTGKLAEAHKLTQDILELEVQEKTAHDGIWKRRGSLVKRVSNVLREAETEVAAVIEGDQEGGGLSPSPAKRTAMQAASSRAKETIAWNSN